MRPSIAIAGSLLVLTACMSARPGTGDEAVSSSSSIAVESGAAAAPPSPLIEMVEEIDAPETSPTGTGSLVETIAERGVLEIGVPQAPLVLTIFTNYSCGYCSQFMRDQFPRLAREYVDPGLLRVRILSVPLKKYPTSVLEASVLTCSTVLGKGMRMHEAMLSAAPRTRKSLLALAGKTGMKAASFSACLDAKETANLLKQQTALIEERRIKLLPSFDLHGEQAIGLASYAALRGWIEEIIAKAR